MEVNRENMCVILIDHGVVDDHLPNHVLSALKTCKTRFMSSPKTYNRQAIEEMREKREQLLYGIRQLKLAHENSAEDNPEKKFFVGESPMGGPPGELGRSVQRYRLQKQGSFDGVPMSNLHLTASSDGRGLEVPRHRTSVLSRISECTDEDARSVQLGSMDTLANGKVTVKAEVTERRAEVTESVALDMDRLLDDVDGSSETHAQRFDSGTKHITSTVSETTFQFQDSQSSMTSLPFGYSIDSPISSLPLTPTTAGESDDVFNISLGGEGIVASSSSSRERGGLRLGLSSAGSSNDSVASTGSNKLLARRNVASEKLKLDLSASNLSNIVTQ